jgi:hypothetical protein
MIIPERSGLHSRSVAPETEQDANHYNRGDAEVSRIAHKTSNLDNNSVMETKIITQHSRVTKYPSSDRAFHMYRDVFIPSSRYSGRDWSHGNRAVGRDGYMLLHRHFVGSRRQRRATHSLVHGRPCSAMSYVPRGAVTRDKARCYPFLCGRSTRDPPPL